MQVQNSLRYEAGALLESRRYIRAAALQKPKAWKVLAIRITGWLKSCFYTSANMKDEHKRWNTRNKSLDAVNVQVK